ncbi:hypothetical protein KOR42_53420 [Thalassoglobus neptunius]|uniref:Uncharacterized protein n=1 Tax=Thalassoglobus neptunius TaxID=1938619 RepID=A0A5C5VBB5_9PLAN|nr:hypothetical protein KOR42_53420 [Thalassoglobus neptunius]
MSVRERIVGLLRVMPAVIFHPFQFVRECLRDRDQEIDNCAPRGRRVEP